MMDNIILIITTQTTLIRNSIQYRSKATLSKKFKINNKNQFFRSPLSKMRLKFITIKKELETPYMVYPF